MNVYWLQTIYRLTIEWYKMYMHCCTTGVVSEMMKASGSFGTRWLTDLINNIVKEGCIPDDWRKSILVPVYKGIVDLVVCGHTDLLS